MGNENLLKVVTRNVSRFAEKDAKDIMTHRKNIIVMDADKTLEEAARFVMKNAHTRVPVYEEDIDNLIGILHIRDLLECYINGTDMNNKISSMEEYIRPILYIPETKKIESLFKEMQTSKNHIVIVLDEYGMTSGLVTMEDILEEIVGDIFDEYDTVKEYIHHNPDGTYTVRGLTQLEDLGDALKISFAGEEDFDTLNGFLIDQLEHIPSEDEKCVVDYNGYRFHILQVKNNIIRRVKIEKSNQE